MVWLKKKSIGCELGEEELLLPKFVNFALTANDRIKYYLTLLQTVREKAEHPQLKFPSLITEKENVGEKNSKFDRVVPEAFKKEQNTYFIPFVEEILSRVWGCMDEMLKPLLATGRVEGKEFEARFEELKSQSFDIEAGISARESGILREDFIRAQTSGDRGKGDSLHILVMDIHRILNKMQKELAVENLDGARIYLVSEEDRELIIAFMAGVNRTFS